MKKIISSICIIIMCFLLQGCDRYTEKRPTDQDNTKWVSQKPDIYGDITGNNTYGKIIIDGVATEIAVDFLMAPRAYFRSINAFQKKNSDGELYDALNDWLFKGSCKFSRNKLVVKITDNSKGFLDDSIKEITFIKEVIND